MKGKFAVLLASFNGQEFIEAQLNSVHNQTAENIDVWISDDGSTDNTVEIAENYGRSWDKGSFKVICRKQKTIGKGGIHKDMAAVSQSNENFRSLILNKDIEADFYAFCDQDDIWHSDKLERAAAFLSSVEPGVSALFCSRTKIVNKHGVANGFSPSFKKQPSFSNAIVQNIAAGNTIVMNKSAMEFIRLSAQEANYVSHDWWCYLAISAIGGKVHFCDRPTLDYRQHDKNLIGENASWKARMIRLKLVMSGRFSQWNSQNLSALETIKTYMEPKNVATMNEFKKLRESSGFFSAIRLFSCGVHRQTFFGQLALFFACSIGKI